jgi:hypothetical protein
MEQFGVLRATPHLRSLAASVMAEKFASNFVLLRRTVLA